MRTLKTYRQKRDFTQTPEPKGKKAARQKFPIFVIQKHAATRLHYDLRLEVNGVLKSWAVPKGPSYDTSDKRLAVQTEDHPFDYATFEGIIPEGHYGAGPVIVWDTGFYINISEQGGHIIPIEKALAKGHASVWLEGEKIKGGFTLARMRQDDKAWLLFKRKDTESRRIRNPVKSKPRSVKSGLTIEDLLKHELQKVTKRGHKK